MAQQPHSRGHGGQGHEGIGVEPELVSIPALLKTATFPIQTLSRKHFIPMYTFSVMLPAGYLGSGSPKTQAAFIVYSHVGRNGGVLGLYELPVLKGVAPEPMMKKLVDARIFKDLPHKGAWSSRTLKLGSTVVCFGSAVPFALDDAAEALKH